MRFPKKFKTGPAVLAAVLTLFFIFFVLKISSYIGTGYRYNIRGLSAREIRENARAFRDGYRPVGFADERRMLECLAAWGDRRRLQTFWNGLSDESRAALKESAAQAFEANGWYDRAPATELSLIEEPPVRQRQFFISGKTLRGPVSIAGNWDEKGRLANASGWKPANATRKSNGWAAGLPLEDSSPKKKYHCVIRDGNIPVGSFQFSVSSNTALVRFNLAQAFYPALRPQKETAPPARKGKVLFIGLDMGSWQAIMPQIQAGLLPGLARLLHTGAYGVMQSLPAYPGRHLVSGVLMTAATTGQEPARNNLPNDWYIHNIFLRTAPIWTIAAINGISADMIGWQGSWPVDRRLRRAVSDAFFGIKLFQAMGKKPAVHISMIEFAKMMDVSSDAVYRVFGSLRAIAGSSTTWPRSLAGAAPPHQAPSDGSSEFYVLRALEDYIDPVTFDLADAFSLDPSALLALYVRPIDRLSHDRWMEFEPDEPHAAGSEVRARPDFFADPISRCLRNLDARIGPLAASYENVFLFSDHGAMPPVPYANQCILDWDRIIQERLPDMIGKIQLEHTVDFSLKVRAASAEDLRRALNRFKETKLKDGRAAFTIEPFAADSFRVSVSLPASDIPTFRLEGPDFGDPPLIRKSIAGHAPDGIFIFSGKLTKKEVLLEDVQLLDIAPTVLAALGLPPSQEMPGRVLREAFEPGSAPAAEQKPVPTYGPAGSGWWRLIQSLLL